MHINVHITTVGYLQGSNNIQTESLLSGSKDILFLSAVNGHRFYSDIVQNNFTQVPQLYITGKQCINSPSLKLRHL
jgi:hypothetical protein